MKAGIVVHQAEDGTVSVLFGSGDVGAAIEYYKTANHPPGVVGLIDKPPLDRSKRIKATPEPPRRPRSRKSHTED